MNAIIASGLANVRIRNVRSWLTSDSQSRRDCSWADIIIIHRVLTDDTHSYIEAWRNKGKAVVLAADDDYFRIREDNAAYKFWGKGLVTVTMKDGKQYDRGMDGSHPIAQFKRGLEICTAAITPSELLCEDWSPFTPTFFTPNYIDTDIYSKFKRREKRGDKIVIGWGGSLSHLPSFTDSGVLEALRKIITPSSNIYLLIVGDKRVLELLNLPRGKVLFAPFVKWDDWPRLLGSRYDIGIAPLAGEYDMRRSWIKTLEYAVLDIPFVATKGYPYRLFFDYFTSMGRFVNQGDLDKGDKPNPEGWEIALRDVIENRSKMEPVDITRFSLENYGVSDLLQTYDKIIRIN